MVTNMYTAITNNYTIYNTADVQFTLTTPISISEIETKMGNLPEGSVESYEVYLSLPSTLSYQGDIKSGILLECYQKLLAGIHLRLWLFL